MSFLCARARAVLVGERRETLLKTSLLVGSRYSSQRPRGKLKNDNSTERKIWRYQHYRSHAPFAQKKALVTSCLRKVHKMASDGRTRYTSALDKLREFVALSYPLNLLRSICNLLAYSTGDRTWIGVRNSIEYLDTTRLRDHQSRR